MKTIKPKICRQCWKSFVPTNSLSNCCSFKCYDKYKLNKEKQKKAQKIEAKKISVSVLSKKLDKIFSEYIRKRDALETTWTLQKIRCITCWEIKDYYQFDCWHFITRASKSTRWEEKNCNAQCKVCNNWWWWRQYEHWKAIDLKYWNWTADLLVRLWHEPQKLSSERLQERIKYFEEKIKYENL